MTRQQGLSTDRHRLETPLCSPPWPPTVCTHGEDTQLFSGKDVRPRFPECGACQLFFISERGVLCSGVARAFPGGRPAHPVPQLEEENKEKLRKDERKSRRMRKCCLLAHPGLIVWLRPWSCELKPLPFKFGGLRAKIWAKIDA